MLAGPFSNLFLTMFPDSIGLKLKYQPVKSRLPTTTSSLSTENNVDKIEDANVENIPINDEVANEVADLVQNLQNEVEGKERRIKFLESEKHGLENKVKTLTIDLKTSK